MVKARESGSIANQAFERMEGYSTLSGAAAEIWRRFAGRARCCEGGDVHLTVWKESDSGLYCPEESLRLNTMRVVSQSSTNINTSSSSLRFFFYPLLAPSPSCTLSARHGDPLLRKNWPLLQGRRVGCSQSGARDRRRGLQVPLGYLEIPGASWS